MEKRIGIVFADEMEFLPFLRLTAAHAGSESVRRGKRAAAFTLQKGDRTLHLLGVECGIGKVAAAAATASAARCSAGDDSDHCCQYS